MVASAPPVDAWIPDLKDALINHALAVAHRIGRTTSPTSGDGHPVHPPDLGSRFIPPGTSSHRTASISASLKLLPAAAAAARTTNAGLRRGPVDPSRFSISLWWQAPVWAWIGMALPELDVENQRLKRRLTEAELDKDI
ncbi:MAG: hypothetical protein ACK5LN_02510 [Propioniciclava sp.]